MLVPNRHGNSSDYRYGFQGQEKDDEVKGESNSINYKFRMHDPRVGRFFAVDPLTAKYVYLSPYQFSSNQPIHAVEMEGLESGGDLNAILYMEGKISKEDYFKNINIRAGGAAVGLSLTADLMTGANGLRFLGQVGTGMALGDFHQAILETEKAYEAMDRGDQVAAEKHLIQAGDYSKGMVFEGLGGIAGYAIGNLYKTGKAFLQVSKGSDEFLNFSISANDEIYELGEAGLNNGVLEMSFQIPYELQGQGIGTEMFETALKSLGDDVKSVQGLWTDGTNLDLFKKALESGKTPSEAAFETVTGKWAKDKGFDVIESITSIKSRKTGEIMSVKVKFGQSE